MANLIKKCCSESSLNMIKWRSKWVRLIKCPSAVLLQTTGLVGLAVSHNPHEVSTRQRTHHTEVQQCALYSHTADLWEIHFDHMMGVTDPTKKVHHGSLTYKAAGELVASVHSTLVFSQRLRILYSKILASLQTMPQDAAYRKYTEQLVNERFNHVKTVSK